MLIAVTSFRSVSIMRAYLLSVSEMTNVGLTSAVIMVDASQVAVLMEVMVKSEIVVTTITDVVEL